MRHRGFLFYKVPMTNV